MLNLFIIDRITLDSTFSTTTLENTPRYPLYPRAIITKYNINTHSIPTKMPRTLSANFIIGRFDILFMDLRKNLTTEYTAPRMAIITSVNTVFFVSPALKLDVNIRISDKVITVAISAITSVMPFTNPFLYPACPPINNRRIPKIKVKLILLKC